MPDLSDLRLEWDAFWSEFHSRNAPKSICITRIGHRFTKSLRFCDHNPKQQSLLLGLGPHNRPIRVYPTKSKPQIGNVLDIGTSQSGKSTRAIAQVLDFSGSVIVNDIKDEIRPATAGFRSILGNGKVFTINVTGSGNRYDPLEGRNSERELYDSAKHILHNPHERENYWVQRATRMLTQIFLAARMTGERPLLFAARLIHGTPNDAAARLNAIEPQLARIFLEAEYTPNKNFQNESRSFSDAWTTLTASLYPILTDDILPSFSGSDFTAKDILFSSVPVTIYFCWPEEDIRSLMPLMRLVWESLIADLKRTCRLYRPLVRQKLLIELDEAGVTGLSGLPEDAATLNGRGVSFSLSAQDIEQFKTLYGESRAKTLLNNVESRIIHRQAGYDTIRYFQLLMDNTSGFATSNNKHGDTQSEGQSEREIPLVTVRQFQELDDADALILHRHIPPIWARRLSASDVPYLAKRLNIDVPQLPLLPMPAKRPLLSYWPPLQLSPGPMLMPFGTIPLPANGWPSYERERAQTI